MAINGQSTDQAALLDAELELWTTTFSYIKSMALKSALDLKLADAIHSHGGAATLPQIITKVDIHPSKIPCLRRLMRTLTASGVFTLQQHNAKTPANEPTYTLTPSTQLLVSSRPRNLASIMAMLLNPALVIPFLEIGSWFRHPMPDPCIFSHTHGEALWDMAGRDPWFDALINDGMVSDSRFIMDVAVKECGQVFEGVGSLVDVGGGLGAASQVISKAFPRLECSVMDLAHVVARAPSGSGVKYVAGDMFESVPPADAVFLKWVLHDWGDDECVKILKNCKKAIPSRENGGKVIIFDIVVGVGQSAVKHQEMHALFDLYIMLVNGIERDEQEWEKIFLEAGFSGYKIMPVLGFRSIIEVYP
ncbi:O-methyltransferase ZRP4 isoform X2 [Brachypodium distachyon]|uniref:acetylserotonin O-methyltransferase n=1 Tax=Brachypodium distachyon TaxID=15368 RepID=I1HHM7_BRADI|nr:O-methyltransferase ZRP4 isoform X2 [Brachypodium distachyon]KQK05395.1 hypothetical protein BRADI_2g19857v3 [Brachypodium distachyon]|eukprot:XP_014754312.1 O-methyltransferase ZRP4 isoform X2 [Brachypodium distachyon]